MASNLNDQQLTLFITCLGLAAFTAYELLFSLIHRITSRVFVGRAFCYNSIWNDAVTALPVDVEITKFIRLPFPDSIRRFVAPLIPQRNRIFRHRAAVRDLLLPPSEDITVKEEPSVLKLLLLSGKDMNPDTIAARLLLLTAAAVRRRKSGKRESQCTNFEIL